MIRNFFNQKYKFSKKIYIKNIFFFSKTDFTKINFTIIPKKKKKMEKKEGIVRTVIRTNAHIRRSERSYVWLTKVKSLRQAIHHPETVNPLRNIICGPEPWYLWLKKLQSLSRLH